MCRSEPQWAGLQVSARGVVHARAKPMPPALKVSKRNTAGNIAVGVRQTPPPYPGAKDIHEDR